MTLKRTVFLPLYVFLIILGYSAELSAQSLRGGFLRNFNAVRNDADDPLLTGRNRLFLDIGKYTDNGQLFVSFQAINSYADSLTKLSANIREAYVDLYFANSDLRIGQQIISFGRSEGTFITDIITPLDLTEFLTQPVDVIQIGIPSVKFTRYFGSNYLEAIFSPIQSSNIFPGPENVWFPFRQFDNTPVQFSNNSINETRPLPQGVLRYAFRNNLKWDLDLIAMFWSPGNPAFSKDLIFSTDQIIPLPTLALAAKYLRRPIIAYSGNYILSDRIILRSESAFHFRKYFDYLPPSLDGTPVNELNLQDLIAINNEFNANTDGFLLQRPWLNAMIGVRFNLDFVNISLQAVNEHIFRYDSRLLQDQNFTYGIVQLRKSLLRDKLVVSTLARYHHNGRDLWVNPEASYDLRDDLNVSLGAQIFTGRSNDLYYGHFSFTDYQDLSFLFLKMTAYF